MPEQEVKTNDFDEIIGLATDEELASLGGGEEPEEEAQEQPQEAAGADETPEEGSDDAGEEPVEAQEAAEGDSEEKSPALLALEAKLEEMERANKGILNETRAERERRQAAEENLRKITEALQGQYDAEQAAKSQEEVPDKDEDPAGFLAHQIRQQQKEFQEWRQQQEQQQTQAQHQQAYQQVVQITNADEERFSQEHEDYYTKLAAAREIRQKIIAATHPQKTEEEIAEMVATGDRMFAAQALQEGVSPAQKAYDASNRMIQALNYQIQRAQQGATEAAGTHNPAQAGSTPAPATKPKTKPQTTSLSATSGRSGGRGQKITYAEFANLNLDVPSERELYDQIAGNEALARQIEEQGEIRL